MANALNSSQTRVTGALIAVQVLFGINYVTSKVIVHAFPPILWASVRAGIAGITLFGIATVTGRKRPPFNRKFFVPMMLFALLGVVINQGAFLAGLRHTTATNSAVLNTLIPVFTLLLVTVLGQERLTKKGIAGFLLAFTGVLVIRKVENFSLSDQTFLGDSLTLLNCVSGSLYLGLSKSFVEKHDPIWVTTWLFLLGGLGLTLLAIPGWEAFQWPDPTIELVGCMIFSTLGCTLLAYLLNLWALSQTRSSSVALFIYLQPVVASFLAWIWFGELVTLRTVLSSLLIFGGMLLALANRRQAPID